MKVNAKSSCALNILGYLIQNRAYTADDRVSSKTIASEYSMSKSYITLISQSLKRGGLIDSKKGPGGGHWLAHPVDSITVGDVFEAIKDENEEVREERQLDLFINDMCKNLMGRYFDVIKELKNKPISEFLDAK